MKNTNFPLREVGLKVQIPLEISWIERDVPLDADICEFNLTPETEKNDKSGKNICKYSFKFYRLFLDCLTFRSITCFSYILTIL